VRYATTATSIASAIAATNIVPSSSFGVRSRTAAGSGEVRLVGSYAGQADGVFDVEITGESTAAPTLSEPDYSGVGNGELVDLVADGTVAAQVFDVVCLDLGTPTRQAWVPFQSVILRAQLAGEAGNQLSLRVDQSTLTQVATDFAVTRVIPAGSTILEGEEHNFGALNLEPEGTVPLGAPRVRFGDDVGVYRHWRTFARGRYSYHFSPALVREIPVGTRVHHVSGGRTVRLFDGNVEAETYSGIATLFSLLSAIQSTSTLIEVEGVVAQDRRPGGMACDDLTVYTASYSQGSVREGSVFIRRADLALQVPPSAPTETLEIVCEAAPIPGAEVWSVIGSVSGALRRAITGTLYTDTYNFTVPVQLPSGEAPIGDRSAFLELLPRSPVEIIPTMCVRNFLLGIEARSKEYVFTWTRRPAGECDCRGETVRGFPDRDILGISDQELPGDGDMSDAIPAALQTRAAALFEWQHQFIGANTQFLAASVDPYISASVESNADDNGFWWAYVRAALEKVSGELRADRSDIRACSAVTQVFRDALTDIYGQLDDLPSPVAAAWDTQFTNFQTFMQPLITLVGSDSWTSNIRQAVDQIIGNPATAAGIIAVESGPAITRAIVGATNLTSDMTPVMARARAAVSEVYVAAGLWPPFEGASGSGNAVWQDHGYPSWFVSHDGLLPLQPGHYFYSATMQQTDFGEEPVATREFAIGVAVGCQENLKPGDKLIVRTNPFGNARATYQQGDRISYQIVRADPVELGGGQIGDDTLTFGIRGSAAGALADYELVTTAPAPYSDGGLSFAIQPGGIGFEVGDAWRFAAERSAFRWRLNGGSWADGDVAPEVPLTGGVSARFAGGAAPSWVSGDFFQLVARSVNGPANATAPNGLALRWTGSTVISLGAGAADTLAIVGHTIPESATITLQASNDGFTSTPFSQPVEWRSGSMALMFPATTYMAWRLVISAAGSVDWIYLGIPGRALLAYYNNVPEKGQWQRRLRLAGSARGRAEFGTIRHVNCSDASVRDLLADFEHALAQDDGRMAVVLPCSEAVYCAVSDAVEAQDLGGFQAVGSRRQMSLTVPLLEV